MRWLEKRGYRVTYDSGIFSSEGYLAGSDERRRSEFLRAWKDPHSRAILTARGGYGSIRLLPLSLPKKSRPKIFMGLSDLTVLLNHVSKSTGMVTVHGPVLAGEMFRKLSENLRDKLYRKLESGEPTVLSAPRDFRIFRSGHARGRIWGGNLSTIQSTLSTPFEIPFKGAFLFLEEVCEPEYRIDRMCAQLALSGAFKRIHALLLGQFTDLRNQPHSRRWIESLVRRYLPGRRIPILTGIQAGHGRNEVLFPIGGTARIEHNGRRLWLSPLVGKNR